MYFMHVSYVKYSTLSSRLVLSASSLFLFLFFFLQFFSVIVGVRSDRWELSGRQEFNVSLVFR